MNDLVPFAFRTTPEIKDAAKALTAVAYVERFIPDHEGVERSHPLRFGSMNTALNTLVREGISSIIEAIDAELATLEPALDIVQEMVRMLMDNPALSGVAPFNLPEGSPARRVLELQAAYADWEPEDEPEPNSSHLTGAEEQVFRAIGQDFRAIGDATVCTRADATRTMANIQKRLSELTEAKGALLRARAG